MINCRVAKIEDIKELCRLLNHLFTQEAEFLPDEKAQERGLKKIISDDSDGDNFKAHKFYEKQGFIKSTMIPFRKAIDIC